MLFLVVVCFVFMSTDIAPPNYGNYSPILMKRSDLENSVRSIAPIELENPGKIYLKDTFVYVIEKYKGIHVINNTDATKPVKEKFITLPGIVDISMKGNVLYADNAVDLVAVDVSNLSNVVVVSRIRNVFPELLHPEWAYIPWEFSRTNRPENTVIVEWAKVNNN